MRQGTTSVVPQMQQNKCRALAPEGCFHPDLPESASFSATSSVVPQKAHSDSGFSRCGTANN
jgi:hypothetical protein